MAAARLGFRRLFFSVSAFAPPLVPRQNPRPISSSRFLDGWVMFAEYARPREAPQPPPPQATAASASAYQ